MKTRMLLVVILAIMLSVGLLAGEACAEKKGSPFRDLCMRMFGYAKKTVEKEVNVVGRGIKKGADVVVEEVEDVGRLATGDSSKAKDVLVKPVEGTAEMVGETTYGVINAPIEAGQEIK